MGAAPRAAAKASSASSPKHARILALDYGRRRIGVAISDELGLTARPLPVLYRKNRREDIARLRKIVRANGIARIIVGLPLHLNGRRGEMAEVADGTGNVQSARQAQWLAAVARLQRGKFFQSRRDQVGQPLQVMRALIDRRVRPCGRRAAGRFHRGGDVAGVRIGTLHEDRAGGGFVHVEPGIAVRRLQASVDQIG